MAADGNSAVQMRLPMAEMMGWLRKGVGELMRQAGLQLMDLLMQEEVRELAGERSERQTERTANRWGSERLLRGDGTEGSDPATGGWRDDRTTKKCGWAVTRCSHRGEPLTETVWEKLMLGLSTRNYGQAIRQFTEACWLEKRAQLANIFIEASRAKLKKMMERRIDKTRLWMLLIDATPFQGQMVAALGIDEYGRKTILGYTARCNRERQWSANCLGNCGPRTRFQ